MAVAYSPEPAGPAMPVRNGKTADAPSFAKDPNQIAGTRYLPVTFERTPPGFSEAWFVPA
jgi:hypothetical protein